MTGLIDRTTGAGLVIAVAVLSGLLFLQTTTIAQNPGQQLIGDAVAAMGGRDRIMAVKTLMFEGGGHDFQVDQEYAYDEIGSQFLVYQLRDYKRAYDLAWTRPIRAGSRSASHHIQRRSSAAYRARARR